MTGDKGEFLNKVFFPQIDLDISPGPLGSDPF